jgi:hypothetical protein
MHVPFYYNLSKHSEDLHKRMCRTLVIITIKKFQRAIARHILVYVLIQSFVEIDQMLCILLHADKQIYPLRPKYLLVNTDFSR